MESGPEGQTEREVRATLTDWARDQRGQAGRHTGEPSSGGDDLRRARAVQVRRHGRVPRKLGQMAAGDHRRRAVRLRGTPCHRRRGSCVCLRRDPLRGNAPGRQTLLGPRPGDILPAEEGHPVAGCAPAHFHAPWLTSAVAPWGAADWHVTFRQALCRPTRRLQRMEGSGTGAVVGLCVPVELAL